MDTGEAGRLVMHLKQGTLFGTEPDKEMLVGAALPWLVPLRVFCKGLPGRY